MDEFDPRPPDEMGPGEIAAVIALCVLICALAFFFVSRLADIAGG